MQQPQEKPLRERIEHTAALLHLLCDCLAFTVVVFLRRDFGRRFIGLQGVGILAPLLWPIVMPAHDPRPMFLFFALVLLACLVNRLNGLIRRSAIAELHSRYSGIPLLRLVLRNWNEVAVKQVAEPLFVIAVAMALEPLSPQLAAYLAVAAGALACSVAADRAAEHRRVQDLHDAFLEQQHLAEQFRSRLNQRR